MEIINLKDFKKQINTDNKNRKIKENIKKDIITLIENINGYFETQTDLIETIIQKIKDKI